MVWPTIADLETFTRQTSDDVMIMALEASIDYGQVVLSETDGLVNEPSDQVFHACLDYAASIYTLRMGGVDSFVDGIEGPTPMQRYRKVLLVSRAVGFA